MCTVSIVATDLLVRMVVNRDERLTRTAAWSPVVRQERDLRALFPIDPDGGGTWTGVNEAGLAIALLNRSQSGARVSSVMPTSRGAIGRAVLLHAESLDEAIALVSRFKVDEHAAYRLVMVQARDLAVVSGGGGDKPLVRRRVLSLPEVFSSSSLGDQLVEAPRRRLFFDCLRRFRDPLLAQRAIHRHSWSDRGAISVVMQRSDARTVSRTQVDLRGNEFRVDYEEIDATGTQIPMPQARAC
jgi:hypothetical protein